MESTVDLHIPAISVIQLDTVQSRSSSDVLFGVLT